MHNWLFFSFLLGCDEIKMRHTTHTNNCNDLEVVRAMCYEVPDWRIFIYNFFKEGISYKDLNSNIAMTYKQMVVLTTQKFVPCGIRTRDVEVLNTVLLYLHAYFFSLVSVYNDRAIEPTAISAMHIDKTNRS